MTPLDPVTCPFCQATAAEQVSLFGSQLLLSQYRCTGCGSYFEGIRQDRWGAEAAPAVSHEQRGGSVHDGSRAEH
jgi:hypothetical protein